MNAGTRAEHYFIMIKPASGLCNLACRYCFYADVSQRRNVRSYGIMSYETARRIIENVFSDAEDGSVVHFGFQGGEPTLAGLDFFREFTACAEEAKRRAGKTITLQYALQTNGILLDDGWCRFLYENRFLVGLSLDGDSEIHNANRVDAGGKGSFSRVMEAKRRLEEYRVAYNVLAVLTNQLARYPVRMWQFLLAQDIRYVQFIPCLSELDGGEPSPYALTPARFSSFYTALFPLWAQEMRKGRYISVKFFDDIFQLLLHRRVTACGFTGSCQRQIVVEADGSVYPCDFYATDDWCLGNLAQKPLLSLTESERAREFLLREKPRPTLCRNCRWAKICGGGCARMADNMYVSRDGKQCGYGDFLTHNAEEINRMAAELQRARF